MLSNQSKCRDIPVDTKLEIVKRCKSGEYFQLKKETGFQRKQIKYWAKNEDSYISISKKQKRKGLAALAQKSNYYVLFLIQRDFEPISCCLVDVLCQNISCLPHFDCLLKVGYTRLIDEYLPAAKDGEGRPTPFFGVILCFDVDVLALFLNCFLWIIGISEREVSTPYVHSSKIASCLPLIICSVIIQLVSNMRKIKRERVFGQEPCRILYRGVSRNF